VNRLGCNNTFEGRCSAERCLVLPAPATAPPGIALCDRGLLRRINLIAGWPGIIVSLIISYMYGIWRLRQLQEPSVEEFTVGKRPPWVSQGRGF